jgi:P27 family predicted phage terminase small subunit
MAGRKKKPTELKIIEGTYRKDRDNPLAPKVTGDLINPPNYFTQEQSEVWKYAIENAPKGLLKKLDISVLEIWVTSYVVYRECFSKVQEMGQVLTSPSGYPIVNPYLSNMNKQALIMMKSASEMGFTPTSRSKVSVEQESNTQDPWEALANG